ncbi:MAG TPA: LPS export ABC transporter ATP-binding protein [bacterium]|nr:LPS export ABC transporter ATP-binding protein [bacterium]
MLETKNLKKSFGRKVAVRDISINVGKGEIVGLLGPNGAGKTTTFEMVLGFLKPDKGNIFVDGIDITNFSVWKRSQLGISYLPQEISIFSKLTVEENFYIILESYYKDKKKMKQVVEEYLKKIGLYDMREQPAGTLSGGEKRRLEIGRSLSLNPKFFLLDEPFSGIDPKTVSELQDIVVKLKNSNIGILLTDHNVREALTITDRAYIIYQGKILIEGKPEEILKHPEARGVYFGEKFQI